MKAPSPQTSFTRIGHHGAVEFAIATAAGCVFGIGLYISAMVDAQKVLSFLDIAAISSGGWDPSLAFVMGAGLLVSMIGHRLSARRDAPLFDHMFRLPSTSELDRPLVLGAIIFGVGWGLSGICPGPALANLALLPEQAIFFVISMGVGSYAAYLTGKTAKDSDG